METNIHQNAVDTSKVSDITSPPATIKEQAPASVKNYNGHYVDKNSINDPEIQDLLGKLDDILNLEKQNKEINETCAKNLENNCELNILKSPINKNSQQTDRLSQQIIKNNELAKIRTTPSFNKVKLNHIELNKQVFKIMVTNLTRHAIKKGRVTDENAQQVAQSLNDKQLARHEIKEIIDEINNPKDKRRLYRTLGKIALKLKNSGDSKNAIKLLSTLKHVDFGKTRYAKPFSKTHKIKSKINKALNEHQQSTEQNTPLKGILKETKTSKQENIQKENISAHQNTYEEIVNMSESKEIPRAFSEGTMKNVDNAVKLCKARKLDIKQMSINQLSNAGKSIEDEDERYDFFAESFALKLSKLVDDEVIKDSSQLDEIGDNLKQHFEDDDMMIRVFEGKINALKNKIKLKPSDGNEAILKQNKSTKKKNIKFDQDAKNHVKAEAYRDKFIRKMFESLDKGSVIKTVKNDPEFKKLLNSYKQINETLNSLDTNDPSDSAVKSLNRSRNNVIKKILQHKPIANLIKTKTKKATGIELNAVIPVKYLA